MPIQEQQVGWIAAIIIGGIAGWLAEQFMKSQMGLLMNILLGVIGAVIADWLFGFLGIMFAGWIGYLIAGFIGACILIVIARPFSGGFQRRTWYYVRGDAGTSMLGMCLWIAIGVACGGAFIGGVLALWFVRAV